MYRTIPECLESYPVTDDGDCWLWTGQRNQNGYGMVFRPCSCGEAKVLLPAHRLSYELVVGPIPDGLVLDHLCRVKNCVNPAHLEPVTTRENTLRGTNPVAINASKTHCIRGHEFTPENTLLKASRAGGPRNRRCRICAKESRRAFEDRKRRVS